MQKEEYEKLCEKLKKKEITFAEFEKKAKRIALDKTHRTD